MKVHFLFKNLMKLRWISVKNDYWALFPFSNLEAGAWGEWPESGLRLWRLQPQAPELTSACAFARLEVSWGGEGELMTCWSPQLLIGDWLSQGCGEAQSLQWNTPNLHGALVSYWGNQTKLQASVKEEIQRNQRSKKLSHSGGLR